MGISDEIEVATMTIDEATILEIKATIAFPFQLSMKTFVVQWRQRFVRCTFRDLFIRLFSRFPRRCGGTEIASSVTSAKHAILDMRSFC